jgi:hypothetical protein
MKAASLFFLLFLLTACEKRAFDEKIKVQVEAPPVRGPAATPVAQVVVPAPRPIATPAVQPVRPMATPAAILVPPPAQRVETKVLVVESSPTLDRSKLGATTVLPDKYDAPEKALKSFFSAVHDKNFDVAWESLSLPSRQYFINFYSKWRGISPALAKEMFEKTVPEIRETFWERFNQSSEEAKLVGNATFTVADIKGNIAMVEMTSGGISYHYKAVKEGDFWKLGYVETFPEGLSKAFK